MRTEHVPAFVAEALLKMSQSGEAHQHVGSGLMRCAPLLALFSFPLVLPWCSPNPPPPHSLQPRERSEISRIPVSEFMRDASGAKNASSFLCEISDRLPRLANQNISFLMCFLDGEAYQLRSAVIHMVGNIVASLAAIESSVADEVDGGEHHIQVCLPLSPHPPRTTSVWPFF